MRFHSVAEFSSYCTSDLSLSHNASNTKYSTRGVSFSFPWYRYNKSNKAKKKERKKKDNGGQEVHVGGGGTCCPQRVSLLRLYCSAQTQKERGKKETKATFISGYTQGRHTWTSVTKRLLKFEKRNNIYKQVGTLPAWLLRGSVQCRLGFWAPGSGGVGRCGR